MLRHGGHTGCAAKARGTKKAGQLGQGVLKGAVAVHGHQDGARPAAVHLPKAFGGQAQQVCILVHRGQHGAQHHKEYRVLFRRAAGLQQVFAGVCYKAPVIVLARAVHACERLFVQKAGKAVAQRHFAHQFHHHLVVVAGDVGRAEHAGQFVLAGGHLVVLGFSGHANAPQFVVQLAHEGAHTLGNAAVIVVAQLLPFGRLCTKQGAAAYL